MVPPVVMVSACLRHCGAIENYAVLAPIRESDHGNHIIVVAQEIQIIRAAGQGAGGPAHGG